MNSLFLFGLSVGIIGGGLVGNLSIPVGLGLLVIALIAAGSNGTKDKF